MSFILILAFLFFMGSLTGWVIELFYRRFVSQKKWVNPGFLSGPYLPVYGVGLMCLYMIASQEKRFDFGNPVLEKLILFLFMMVVMTVVEYIGGWFLLKYFRLRLWDYTDQWGNIQGLICPLEITGVEISSFLRRWLRNTDSRRKRSRKSSWMIISSVPH